MSRRLQGRISYLCSVPGGRRFNSSAVLVNSSLSFHGGNLMLLFHNKSYCSRFYKANWSASCQLWIFNPLSLFELFGYCVIVTVENLQTSFMIRFHCYVC